MSKKGENIYKRKDGRWEGRYIRHHDVNGKAKYGYVYGRSYYEVKQKLIELKSQIIKCPNCIRTDSLSYGDVLDGWLTSSKLNTKESTYARYSHLIKAHIKPKLGEYQISRITTQHIEEFAKELLVEGRLDNSGGLSPKTVTDVLTIVKSSFEYAKFMNMPVVCNLSRITIKKEEKEMRVLSVLEQRQLVAELMDEMDLSKFGVLLSLHTGIRIGELCALKWEDIYLSQSTLKVRKTMQRIQDTSADAPHKTKVVITEPKSLCSIREIPLTSSIIAIARQFSVCPKAFVLSGETDRFVEPRTMQNRFKTYARRSGISDVNFHALRHTFATRCVEVGFELKSLSEVLGHANVNITLNRYVHSSFELKSANMNKLDFLE